MIEDIRDWVMATDTPLTLMWHGMDQLHFSDGLHFYRMLEDPWRVDVAPVEGFERWGPSTKYYVNSLPYSKDNLMTLVGLCKHLTENMEVPDDVSIGPLDVGAVYMINGAALSRVEVLNRIDRCMFGELGGYLPEGKEITLRNIEALVDIVQR